MNNIDLEKAFIEIIQQNERIIYKVCSFYISDDATLGDLYQDVVSNLWVAYPKFRSECPISTWIYRIALNTCISSVRKELKKPQRVPLSQLPDIFEQTEDSSPDVSELYRLIYQLKDMERAIILLYLEEKSYQQIADIVGLTVCNVAIKLKRTKEKLLSMSNK